MPSPDMATSPEARGPEGLALPSRINLEVPCWRAHARGSAQVCGRKAPVTNDISSFHHLEFLVNEAPAPLGGGGRLR